MSEAIRHTRALALIAAVLWLVALTLPACAAEPSPPPPPTPEQPSPPSCQMLSEEQRRCAIGVACDKRAIARLRRACQRDGGQPSPAR